MKRFKTGKRVMILFLLMAFALAGCSMTSPIGEPTPLNPKGSVADDQLWLIQLSIGIMIVVMAVVFALTIYVVIRFRKRRGDDSVPEQVEGNHKLEIIWTVIPLILITILAVPTVQTTFKLAEDYTDHKDAIKIKVTAHQFWWKFEYEDFDIVTAQDMYIPVGKKVQVDLLSADVAHSFWIPGLAGKTDTLPGLTNKMHFDANEPGVYKGKCAELCGEGHALMDFKVIAVSEEDFEQWVKDMTTPVTAMSEEALKGQEAFQKNGCINCHAITPGGASAGPNLNNFADRLTVGGFRENTPEWISKWIANPQEVKPGATMPAIPLDDEDLQAIVEYMQSLNNRQ